MDVFFFFCVPFWTGITSTPAINRDAGLWLLDDVTSLLQARIAIFWQWLFPCHGFLAFHAITDNIVVFSVGLTEPSSINVTVVSGRVELSASESYDCCLNMMSLTAFMFTSALEALSLARIWCLGVTLYQHFILHAVKMFCEDWSFCDVLSINLLIVVPLLSFCMTELSEGLFQGLILQCVVTCNNCSVKSN